MALRQDECGRKGETSKQVGKGPAVREVEDQGHGGKNVFEVADTAFQVPRQAPLGGSSWGHW